MNKAEKWDRGKTLLLESLYKPDTKLRGCAYNQECYDEMISLRDQAIDYVKGLSNPYESVSEKTEGGLTPQQIHEICFKDFN